MRRPTPPTRTPSVPPSRPSTVTGNRCPRCGRRCGVMSRSPPPATRPCPSPPSTRSAGRRRRR
ncbi:MAG TPA: hypothetical protein DIW82_05910 [Corynebacterium nuruki]|uniref:Uncharacterized protein n=1 Tax=Corynebacterium nuruki TaxID=1032851 RepID=A0A3D4SZ87_9CORY|nr:hypothetical protein [Corynebacterium nuruki]